MFDATVAPGRATGEPRAFAVRRATSDFFCIISSLESKATELKRLESKRPNRRGAESQDHSVEDWAEAMTQGGPFGRPRGGKDVVERSTAHEFAKSIASVSDRLVRIVSKGAEPPDILARVGSRQVGIELVEFLNEKVRAKRARLKPGYPGEFADRQWSKRDFQGALNRLLDKKQDKYARAGFVADVLVIHSGELWLTWATVKQWIAEMSFEPRPNLRSAYLLLFYDPSYMEDHWPLFTLYGDLGA